MITRALLLFFTLLIAGAFLFAESGFAQPHASDGDQLVSPLSDLEQGKALAFDRNLGNCLACHFITGGELPGNVGPPLVQMRLRFPDREVLRAQIWDAKERNPNTVMPPYGRHGILTEQELDLVVDYVHGL